VENDDEVEENLHYWSCFLSGKRYGGGFSYAFLRYLLRQ
jgi:hypothetical protein